LLLLSHNLSKLLLVLQLKLRNLAIERLDHKGVTADGRFELVDLFLKPAFLILELGLPSLGLLRFLKDMASLSLANLQLVLNIIDLVLFYQPLLLKSLGMVAPLLLGLG